jgi:hypothetical protein
MKLFVTPVKTRHGEIIYHCVNPASKSSHSVSLVNILNTEIRVTEAVDLEHFNGDLMPGLLCFKQMKSLQC